LAEALLVTATTGFTGAVTFGGAGLVGGGVAFATTLGLETVAALGITAFGAGADLGWTLATGLATGLADLVAAGLAALTGAFAMGLATDLIADLTADLTADFAFEAPGLTLEAGLAAAFGFATGFDLAGADFLAIVTGFLALAVLLTFTAVFLGAGFPLTGALAAAFLGATFFAGLAFLEAGFADLVFF
jgi:hypothetical protein